MKKISFVVILIILIVGLAAVWWKNGTSAVNRQNPAPTIFVIEKGQGIRDVANKLKQENLIKDPVVFFLLVKQLGLDGKIQAGSFRLNQTMTADEIANGLTHGTLDIWLTIPEGKRAEEIAVILKSIPTYQETWVERLSQQEGYLFPDTYLIPRDADIDQIVSILTNTFESKFKEVTTQNTTLSKEEIVTIASLLEREAKLAEDYPMVSSVIANRLDIGMALQIDATVQYALGYSEEEKTWWKKGLTYEDLEINSPYNTYQNTGVPPGPISNPGLSALQAAANPATSDYLFYISDSTGHNHYAKTNEEHNANIKKYGL